MSNELKARSEQLKQTARSLTGREMKTIGKANWGANVNGKQAAMRIAKRAFQYLSRTIDDILLRSSSPALVALADAKLDVLELLVEKEIGPELRIAQIQGLEKGLEADEADAQPSGDLSPEELAARTDELLGYADSLKTFVKDLRKNPKTYYKIANEFLTGRVAKALPGILKARTTSESNASRLMVYLEKKGIKNKSFLKKAAKAFGIAQVGLTITTIVFDTMAEEGKWARNLVSATAATGIGVLLGSAVTTTAVTSVITATFTAAGLTAEVPPVAAALIAAGIVIIGAIALATLFDTLIDFIFGIQDIPPSMRLSMSSQMYSGMSSQMSPSMASSMVSLPQ